MKSLKNIILLIAIIHIPVFTSAQIEKNSYEVVSAKSNQLKNKLSGKRYFIKVLSRGSHFNDKKFILGKLTLEDGEVYDSIMVNYNSYIDELVCYNPNINSLFIIDKFMLKEFEINSPVNGFQKFRKIKFTNYPKGERYFQVLYEGGITLLLYYKTEEINVAPYKDFRGNLRNTEFILTKTYYTYSPESGFNKFPPFGASFLNLYKKDKKQVRQILRKNKLYRFDIPKLKLAFSLIEKAGIKQ